MEEPHKKCTDEKYLTLKLIGATRGAKGAEAPPLSLMNDSG